MENIKYKIGSGEMILFWKDWWVGDRTLGAQFPGPFNCAKDMEAEVKAYMARIGDQVVWSPTLRRNLKDNKESQVILLLNGMFNPKNGEDERVLTASKDGTFSISSFFSAITNKPRERSAMSSIWKLKAPSRVVIFGWMTLRKRILIMDNLRSKEVTVVNGCPMCLRDEEGGPPFVELQNYSVCLEVGGRLV
eukprot:TRINITY_DN11759_c0_g1_i1.p1 TRINITY_DN11759_c0_g1~~TRINITY_DN11759_c0_g1_i1.p1  ORF type:complete len:192 (+),score=29.59 TRINITY_DN11759_c0_g1_i1:2619-3194(+)